MTIAVSESLMKSKGKSENEIREAFVNCMQKWGNLYSGMSYGGNFNMWLKNENPLPYGSYGNGSAMRVSSVGWLYDTLGETRVMAKLSAEVTHNHPEGIKGAESVASAIFLSRAGQDKAEIKKYITQKFGYDLSRTCDEICPDYLFDKSCQKTVPEAITAFLEGESFEDVIRTAVSLGGDCDTLTCIAGGIAEAFYGVPFKLKIKCRRYLTKNMLSVFDQFEKERRRRK